MKHTPADVRLDKLGMSHYLRNYEEFLGPLRDKPIRLLELGIAEGASLKYWRDWLPNAAIVGLDVKAVSLDDPSGRIRCYQGEQQDVETLDRIGRETAPDGFDVIIDDASHVGQFTRLSFWHLYENHLKPGGLYFIEDWGTGYWRAYPDGRPYIPPKAQFAPHERFLNALHRNPFIRKTSLLRRAVGYLRWHGVKRRFPSHDYGMVGFVKELVDECGMADITHASFGRGAPVHSRIEWMRVSLGHVIVKKPASPLPE